MLVYAWSMSDCGEHVMLHVAGSDGAQAVPVRRLPNDELEVLFSPGFVEGIAAGDLVRVTDATTGTFEVLRRGGNVSVKLFREAGIEPLLAALEPELGALQARVDGRIERGAVLTIPVTAGFTAIEAALRNACAAFPDAVCYFGNVYDDAGQPLNWWCE